MPPKGHQVAAALPELRGGRAASGCRAALGSRPRRDGNRTAGPQLGEPAAGTAGRANGCPAAHRVSADRCRSSSASPNSTASCARCIWLRSHVRSVRRCCWSPRWACTGCCSAVIASKTLVSASHSYAIAGLLLLGVALAGVSIIIFDLVAGPVRRRGSPAGARWLALACFWFLLPLRERGESGRRSAGFVSAVAGGTHRTMLIRRIARPMLSAVFIGRGVDALRSPKPAADAARPTLEGLSKLPDPVGANVPSNAETVARINGAVQIGGGLLLATGKLPRLASAAARAQRGSGQPWRTYVLERGRSATQGR